MSPYPPGPWLLANGPAFSTAKETLALVHGLLLTGQLDEPTTGQTLFPWLLASLTDRPQTKLTTNETLGPYCLTKRLTNYLTRYVTNMPYTSTS